MKFGIFYEHQLPRPWGPKSEYQLLQDSLSQIELADRLGYDYAWEVEHHFLEEYSHSSAPEVFLGAASQRTKRIRLGHGVVQLTTNQPHRVAERVATLDLLSGGRVDLGMGEAAGPAELHPFNIRVRDKRERWEEAVKAIVRCSPGRAGSSTASTTTSGAQRHSQAVPEAASAAVGRLLQHPDHRQGRRMGHGRARLHLRHARGGARLGAQVLQQPAEQLVQAHRLSEQSQRRHGVGLHVRASDAEARPRPPAGRSSSLRCRTTAAKASTRRAPRISGRSTRAGRRPEEKKALESGLIGSPRRSAGSCGSSRRAASTR
jgi:alkanesulfonate monooxygenase SsuD/methylene tetrahydromethanopterin reductase-like flavin-dependent oxidoreductase (luciferase family)